MTSLRQFVILLFAAFFAPWLILIAIPHANMRAAVPVVLDEDDPGKGTYPPQRSNIYKDGEIVFAKQGCANCHTQVIRPTYLGIDSFKRGWGREQEGMAHTRESRPMDYYGDRYAFIGIQRNGPDLANFGHRVTDLTWIHTHLYNPRQHNDWSTMPSYRHLYEERKIQGQRSANALDLKGDMAPPEGHEVVPSVAADALVNYLITLKRDGEVPTAAEQATAAETGEAAAVAK
jgi:cytochrome c oxidase cbb3-type subunit 2